MPVYSFAMPAGVETYNGCPVEFYFFSISAYIIIKMVIFIAPIHFFYHDHFALYII